MKWIGANNQKYAQHKTEEERVNLKDGDRVNYDKQIQNLENEITSLQSRLGQIGDSRQSLSYALELKDGIAFTKSKIVEI